MILSFVLVIKFYADWQTVAYGDFATMLHHCTFGWISYYSY